MILECIELLSLCQ